MTRPFPRLRRTLARSLVAALLGACALPALAALAQAEKDALLDLYNSTDGAGWSNDSGWSNPSSDPCAAGAVWYGLTCDAAGEHVTGISLIANSLGGTLPSTLNRLTALETLDLNTNPLSGPIPNLDGLTALSGFFLNNNKHTGPIPSLRELTALRAFYVSSNELSGAIPSLDGLTALEEFDASRNQLTSAIPSLRGLTALRTFIVYNNELTGATPSLSGLIALNSFYVDNNQLTGPIPSLAGLTALEVFSVSNNQLSGPIPSSLSGLTALQSFFVSDNQLTGTPPAAPAGLNAGGSQLCPNLLHTPSADDAAWDTATGSTWSTDCTPGYLVEPSAGVGGSVGPAQGVVSGATATIAITPDAGQMIDGIASTCGGTLTGNSFTTDPVTADCTVAVKFRASAPVVAAVTPVPTLGEWGLMLLGALAAGLGARRLRRVG